MLPIRTLDQALKCKHVTLDIVTDSLMATLDGKRRHHTNHIIRLQRKHCAFVSSVFQGTASSAKSIDVAP